MIKAVIFDVDGVMIDTEEANALATIEMFKELYGMEPKPEDFRPFVGTGSRKYVEGVAQKYGVRIDLPQAIKKREENFKKFLDRLGVFPGIQELLEKLKRKKLKVAICTSADRSKFEASFQAVGFKEEDFDLILTGNEITRTKPHPEIYEKAVKKLELSPEECLVIEDSLTGIEAAKLAGCKVVGIANTFSPFQLKRADWVVKRAKEIEKIIWRGECE